MIAELKRSQGSDEDDKEEIRSDGLGGRKIDK